MDEVKTAYEVAEEKAEEAEKEATEVSSIDRHHRLSVGDFVLDYASTRCPKCYGRGKIGTDYDTGKPIVCICVKKNIQKAKRKNGDLI